ncbi:hypothetical protein E3E31_01295 [Thermococcus sp. M39]|uniref:hypothetical protein n=1 Tax=unclassified Thermococcus TaxID=2627626 RepID=UPI001438C6B8|nr:MULTISPECIES: hypothetical protein [unclassified Thermococcus]NJE07191.1 hypothetical protein [Thermococcus sp. M39]NJE12677.1 hypothetical protein [Thermococcus sp. LS2]
MPFWKRKKEEKKPQEKTWDEILEEFARKYGLPKENIDYISSVYTNPANGLLKILARASPDGSYKLALTLVHTPAQAHRSLEMPSARHYWSGPMMRRVGKS